MTGTSPLTVEVNGLLSNLQLFKSRIDERIGQNARTVIKKSVQRVDPEWMVTILRIMKMIRIFSGINHPWNAFQSAFAEPPFDVYAMTRCQSAMLYHTMKDHFDRHVNALTTRPTGSLWDYVPEPRLYVARPLINDLRAGVGHPEFATEACFVCNVFGPCPCTHPGSTEVTDSAHDDRGDAEDALRCLGCGRFIHRDDVYPCIKCHTTPFHLECLEPHYEKVHPQRHQSYKEKKRAKEEEVLHKEADDARTQWVDQMTKLSRIAMPLNRRIASGVIALISVALSVEPFWSTPATDVPTPLLQ